jgi:hypothetical protein
MIVLAAHLDWALRNLLRAREHSREMIQADGLVQRSRGLSQLESQLSVDTAHRHSTKQQRMSTHRDGCIDQS